MNVKFSIFVLLHCHVSLTSAENIKMNYFDVTPPRDQAIIFFVNLRARFISLDV